MGQIFQGLFKDFFVLLDKNKMNKQMLLTATMATSNFHWGSRKVFGNLKTYKWKQNTLWSIKSGRLGSCICSD